jgi:hypothetical protein
MKNITLTGTTLTVALILSGCALPAGLGSEVIPNNPLTSNPATPPPASEAPSAPPSDDSDGGGDGGQDGSLPDGHASSSGNGAQIETDRNGIAVLEPDQSNELLEWMRSEPAGSYRIGYGAPDGMPAGIPFYVDKWVGGSPLNFESNGRAGYGVSFWVTWDDIDALIPKFEELGYELTADGTPEEQRRLTILESPDYRITITSSENADDGDGGVLDPMATYTIIFL